MLDSEVCLVSDPAGFWEALQAHKEWLNSKGKSGSRLVCALGLDLSGVEMPNVDLTEADFSGAILEGATLDRCKLSSANFRWAKMEGCSMVGATAYDARFENAKMRRINGEGALFRGSRLLGVDFHGSKLGYGGFPNCVMSGSKLTECDLQGSLLRNSDLRGADLRGSNCTDVDFTRALVGGAYLSDVRGLPKVGELGSLFMPDPDELLRTYLKAQPSASAVSGVYHTSTQKELCDWYITLAEAEGRRLEDKFGSSVAAALLSLKAYPDRRISNWSGNLEEQLGIAPAAPLGRVALGTGSHKNYNL